MATITASLLIGSAHQNHGGIGPSHQLLLSENSRPAWSLYTMHSAKPRAVWTPTVEHMLDDGLLMIGLLVARDARLVAAAGAFRRGYAEGVEMYDDADEPERRHLYELCRTVGPDPKVVVTVLDGSTIAGQLGVLSQYRFDVEVCPSVFRRGYSAWSQSVQESGTIPGTRSTLKPGTAPDPAT